MENRMEEAKRIVDEMEKESNLNKVEELIKDNKITFEHDGKKYRVHLLNTAEKDELDILRRKKFGQLIKDEDILFEKEMIKVLKTKGIDIDEMDKSIKDLNAEQINLQLKLGESISKNENETILKTYKEQIEELQTKIKIINTQKNLLLEYSLENTLLCYVASLICYLSIDEMVDGKWQRRFSSLEDFKNCDDETLINKAASFSILLQYS